MGKTYSTKWLSSARNKKKNSSQLKYKENVFKTKQKKNKTFKDKNRDIINHKPCAEK